MCVSSGERKNLVANGKIINNFSAYCHISHFPVFNIIFWMDSSTVAIENVYSDTAGWWTNNELQNLHWIHSIAVTYTPPLRVSLEGEYKHSNIDFNNNFLSDKKMKTIVITNSPYTIVISCYTRCYTLQYREICICIIQTNTLRYKTMLLIIRYFSFLSIFSGTYYFF